MAEVQILSGTRSDRPGPVVLFAVLRIGPIIVRGVKLVRSKDGQGYFVGWPSREVRGGGYEDLCFAPGAEDRAAVLAAMVDAYESGGAPS
jgi:DNA-binding cell septation regulator SpoVG